MFSLLVHVSVLFLFCQFISLIWKGFLTHKFKSWILVLDYFSFNVHNSLTKSIDNFHFKVYLIFLNLFTINLVLYSCLPLLVSIQIDRWLDLFYIVHQYLYFCFMLSINYKLNLGRLFHALDCVFFLHSTCIQVYVSLSREKRFSIHLNKSLHKNLAF